MKEFLFILVLLLTLSTNSCLPTSTSPTLTPTYQYQAPVTPTRVIPTTPTMDRDEMAMMRLRNLAETSEAKQYVAILQGWFQLIFY